MKRFILLLVGMIFYYGGLRANIGILKNEEKGAAAVFGNPANIYTKNTKDIFFSYSLLYPELGDESIQDFSLSFLSPVLADKLFLSVGYNIETIYNIYNQHKGVVGAGYKLNKMFQIGAVYNIYSYSFNEVNANNIEHRLNMGFSISFISFKVLLSAYNVLMDSSVYSLHFRYGLGESISILAEYNYTYLKQFFISYGIIYKVSKDFTFGAEVTFEKYKLMLDLYNFKYTVSIAHNELRDFGVSHKISINYEF